MVKPSLLTKSTLQEALQDLPEWQVDEDHKAITRQLVFDSFPAAMSFMMEAAFIAEAMNHHPEWTNSYNRLEVRMTTHDVKGLTHLDIEYAGRLEKLFASRS